MKTTKELIYENYLSSKQTKVQFAMDLLDAIMNNSDGVVDFRVDDGDGDMWIYQLDINSFAVDPSNDTYLGDGNFADNH